jgi:hypothetical protein
MKDHDYLPDRWRRIIQRVARGEDWAPAARAEGCSPSYARVIRTRMMKNPAVAKALEAIRTEGMKIAVYDLATAMGEAEAVCAFAKKHKNAMAYCKGTELRAKLSGLLIDRVEIVPVNLIAALEAAERRVINVTPLFSDGVLAGSVRWAPRIPGAPIAENHEAGPVDRESVRQVGNVGPENR